ncbi:MAG TPA: tRNA (adenosine(37)-N6)-dimethylallyltransferase MiaA [Candidatus Fimimonas merdipullorum]|uniref:tRNA dimethylallyltransferase n=1 Tax=Candidatus Fimimonas merdipullorum TaxID=2840822 RepID=A0A9D1MWX5_9BACT|nr:tRNA (adenosine(37)-N6)-dimethylallyltransferase MiaA [Candidatus Fimimonas merdipullorum]
MMHFIGITGTTCVGKSRTAVVLAKLLNKEVVSADSMQIYRGMNVGTAKITAEEAEGVPHRLIDVVNPDEEFSAYQWAQAAKKYLNSQPLVVGGTGFYFSALLFPPEFGGAGETRQLLKAQLKQHGVESLAKKLKEIDEQAYNLIDVKNPVRVLRALEIALEGRSLAEGTGKSRQPQYKAPIFVLQRDRQTLYHMIDRRVDQMMHAGLLAEVEKLVSRYGVLDTPAFSAIGYKELIEYLRGKCDLTQAVEQIKQNTRRYAKRQITYFKRLPDVRYVDVDSLTAEQTAYVIADTLKKEKWL